MAHEMDESVVRWAAQRARFALEALEAHDRQTREMLDRAKGGAVMVAGAFEGRSDARIDLAAQVAETSRVLVKAVLG